MNKRINRRTKLKKILDTLPFGIGKHFLLPIIRWALYVFIDRELAKEISNKQRVRNEAKRIQFAIGGGAKEAIVLYDNLVSPPTYGDYLFSVILARYFQAFGVRVTFYIVDSEFRKDWEALSGIEIDRFTEEQKGLAEALLNPSTASIQRVSWPTLETSCIFASTDTIIPFVENIRNRVGTYGDYILLLSYLLDGVEERVLDNVLLSYWAIRNSSEVVPPPMQYVTWHCRRSIKWEIERNVSDQEVLKIYSFLRQRFEGHAIMIVSDDNGCAHLKALSREFGMDLLFSKDYSSTFFGDGALILGGDYHFQFLGGGIVVFAMCSKIPYVLCNPLDIKVMWSRKKLFSWQSDRQVFANKYNYSLDEFLHHVSARVGSGVRYEYEAEAPGC